MPMHENPWAAIFRSTTRAEAAMSRSAELLDDPHVKAAYLGIGDAQVEQSRAPSLNRGSLS
jgi:hypothetical protein